MTNIITDIRDRLMALCEAIVLPAPLGVSHAFRTRQECSFTSADLPAFVVESVPNTSRNTRISADQYMMQRDYNILMALTPIGNEAYEKNMDTWDLVNDCILTVTDAFMQNPPLELNGAWLVEDSIVTRDSGPIPIAGKKDGKYHGAVFRLTVMFTRRVS